MKMTSLVKLCILAAVGCGLYALLPPGSIEYGGLYQQQVESFQKLMVC